MSDQFLSRLIEGYVLIQKERYSEASDHFNRMLYSPHNPNDDDIIWIAKSHIYKKLGHREESKICMKLVTDKIKIKWISRDFNEAGWVLDSVLGK